MDHQRVYSDEEFAAILRKATELAVPADGSASSSTGLTLAEMQAAAAQAGIDPVLVERAARELVATAPLSTLERLLGGPIRHAHEVHLPMVLNERTAASLLSAVRISAGLAGRRDVGHAAAMGMTWHDGGDAEALAVSARPDHQGTALSIVLDRRGTLGLVAMTSGIVLFLLTLFAIFGLYPESPALGVGGFVVGVSGVLTMARRYWSASTQSAQARTRQLLHALSQMLAHPDASDSAGREAALTTPQPATEADPPTRR